MQNEKDAKKKQYIVYKLYKLSIIQIKFGKKPDIVDFFFFFINYNKFVYFIYLPVYLSI